jgi:hypothetical protein
MAQNTSLEGLRSQLLTQVHGRRLALDPNEYLVGPKELRVQVEGFNAGTTVTSTSVASNLSAWGVSLLGATLASGTTAYNLAAPVPGVRKTLFCPTTGVANVLTTGAGAFILTTGSAASTYGIISFAGKGNVCEMIGITTALWAVLTNYSITSVTTGNTVSFV